MSQLEAIKKLDTYRVVEHKMIEEMQSEGIVLEHKKTKARLFLVSNDDENKVFCIGFRTPPDNDCGLPHILEHSVLCGSDKFPLKDPFVELVKGSLNTFLNAMTYPDKTVYPVASCNDKDFHNLMDVYMDAVLHPNIYKEEKIFRQEGWHYELESKDAPLIYNGVVYNEMKGAYSSPESILDSVTQKTLFPDTCYGKDSGGDPVHIPELSYEKFLDFHRTYYHPSNSYIYLYGDMDMAEKLTWLDEEYLSHYEERPVDSRIREQKAFAEPVEREFSYSITEGESEEDATYLSVNTVVGDDLDPKLYVAFQILEYTLLDAPGAPLKQALIDAGIGKDVMGGYESGILQPYFSVIAKDANKEQKGEFLAIVKGTLRKLADQGINRKSLLAGMNYFEFKYREADYGSAPKGLMYGLQCLDSWLYDGDPMTHLCYQETFDFLKKEVENGYFEQLIRDYLLDNPFEAVIVVAPEKNLTVKEDEKLAKKLAAYKASLSEEELEKLVTATRELKEYQDTPSTPEILAKIPLLKREDIEKKAETFFWKEKEEGGIKVLHHNFFTSGIGYLKVLFNTEVLPQEDLPYAGMLKYILGSISTEHYSYSDLTSEIHLNSGGVDFSVTSYPDLADPERFTGAFVASIRVLYDKLDFGFTILEEILNHSVFTDEKRLGEVIQETRSRAKMKLENAGHSTAVSRATSYFSATAYYNELTGGTAYYHFLEQLEKDYANKKGEIMARLQEVSRKLFTRANMLVNYTADDKGYEQLPQNLKLLADKLPQGSGEKHAFTHPVKNVNEGLKTSAQVDYVARCGNFRDAGLEYTGALKILQVILSYDYLWLNIRVKGGAYGCMSGFGRSGEGYLVSYRDPNLKETNDIYEGIPAYLEAFDPDERDMTKYVIGTISNLDAPLTPSVKGSRGLSAYLSGVTEEMMQTERDQILGAAKEDIRALAAQVRAVLATGSFCVVGNEEKIEANRGMFGEVSSLTRG
ncbi:insulinase family protein [Clostridium sp. AF27-2AA]|uniref:insulinase family protein n=1 Tax=Clostridium sp. AF27-2AA TaxID=2292206 RepID=UPI000E48C858|nr:insulinase family protein [Clostridium sp. AF27-2AA]RHQ29647.1 insulinase family protein [Clostridium sp. AF27-2AA]